jgi:hypothetical protein
MAIMDSDVWYLEQPVLAWDLVQIGIYVSQGTHWVKTTTHTTTTTTTTINTTTATITTVTTATTTTAAAANQTGR